MGTNQTTKETRRASYDAIIPKVKERSRLILETLGSRSMTVSEITDELVKAGRIPYYNRNYVAPRLSELKDMFGSCEVASGSYSGKYVADASNSAVLRPESPIQVTSNAEAARFAKGLLRNANKYGHTGQFSKALMTGYAAASLLTLKTTKASMWDGTVFVYKVRHDFVGNKSTVYFRDLLEGY